jgi:apolipoprotein N-acyltransferase
MRKEESIMQSKTSTYGGTSTAQVTGDERSTQKTGQYGGDSRMEKRDYMPIVWFVLGFGIFMTTRASNFIPHISWAIIVAPIFILRFIRLQPARRGILLTLLGFIMSLNIAMWGLFTIGDPTASIIYNLVRNSVLAILFSIPYIADRLIYPKVKANQFLATLAFPIAVTAIQFLISLEGPFDGDMVSAVYGYGNLGFKQIASIAGLWGFVFIFSWSAAVVNFVWERRFKWAEVKPIVLTFALICLAILGFGVVKTSNLLASDAETVKIAAIFLLPEDGQGFDGEGLFSQELSPYEAIMSKIAALSATAASNGVKIVVLQENALKIHESDETNLLDRSKAIARENGVYLSLGYGLLFSEGKGWNKNILISDQGELVVDYRKRFLLGLGEFGETGIYNKGPEVIQSVDTPYGRIGVSICRDMSFSGYARQAGEQQVDIMLNPSYDYPKSTSAMYSLRAIEYGFTMVRPVYNGFSYAVDPNGRLLASMDSDNTNTGIMYADVPTQGINTLYTKIGDLLGWICVFGFLGLVPLSVVLSIRQKKTEKAGPGMSDMADPQETSRVDPGSGSDHEAMASL